MIFRAAKSMSGPFWYMMMSFYLIYFWFAQIGMACYGKSVTSKSVTDVQLYYLLNFNDFGMSLFTLFTVMVGNNWQVTCDFYCAL